LSNFTEIECEKLITPFDGLNGVAEFAGAAGVAGAAIAGVEVLSMERLKALIPC